jgi:hypothetical protein
VVCGVSRARRPPPLDLLGGDRQAELLLERAGHGASDRVRLPSRGFDDLVDGRAALGAEHLDQLRLLGALPALDRGGRRFRRRRLIVLVRDPEGAVGQRGGAQRDRAALLVVPPDRVEIRGGDFLDQALLEKALADVADGAALEAGGDGEDCSVLARAGGGQDDGLGVGKLDLCHGVVSVFGPATCGAFYDPEPRRARGGSSGCAGDQRACSPSPKALSVMRFRRLA